MKSLFTTVILMVITAAGFSQAPDLVNYQAIVRDASGMVVANQVVGIKISVLQGSSTGPAVFSETHTPTTNNYGLVNLQIGNGTNFGPALGTVDWSADIYFVSVEIDPAGGTTYVINSTTQLISVPYAFHARTVEQNDDADADPTNEFNTTVILNGTDLEITDGGGTIITDLGSLVDDADPDPTNEIQTLSKVGSIITLSNGGGAVTDDVNDADANPTNEFNTGVALVGTTLNITDGGGVQSVSLATLADADGSVTNETNTSASLAGTTLSITDPAGTLTVDLSSLVDADGSITNEKITSLGFAGTTLTVNEGGVPYTVSLATLADADGSVTNEKISSLSLSGANVLTVTENGINYTVSLASLANVDNSITNETNTSATLVGTTLSITDPAGTLNVNLSSLGNDADFDPTNEIQSLSLVGTTLSISGGNSVVLGSGTDSQTLSLVGNDLTILNGNTVTLPSGGGTDSQTLSIVGQNVSISGGNTIAIPDSDGQTLSIVGQNVSITGGNTIAIPDSDGQTLTLVGSNLSISGGNTVTLPSSGGAAFQVGQMYQGGMIVWVDTTGLHGLICSLNDCAGTYLFESGANDLPVATSSTNGQANTTTLIATGGYPAATACDTYVVGAYSDWFLPSIYQLKLAFDASYYMGASVMDPTNTYWSSTEAGALNAYRVTMFGGVSSASEIGPAVFVRAFRVF